jgi:UDP-4-amino-4,6-dideoxy-N-acetyl-beta-L-altrosamine N-acetyltransferase
MEFRTICVGDLLQLRKWRNSRRVRTAMADREYVNAQRHRNWYRKQQNSCTELHYIVTLNRERVAYLNYKTIIDDFGRRFVEAGMYLGKSFGVASGLRICKEQIKFFFNDLGGEELYIRIDKDNRFLYRFNLQLGYSKIGESCDFTIMRITKAEHEDQAHH